MKTLTVKKWLDGTLMVTERTEKAYAAKGNINPHAAMSFIITDTQDESDKRLSDWVGVMETIGQLHESDAVYDELERGLTYERAEELLIGCGYLLTHK
jgi:hypothetical protein